MSKTTNVKSLEKLMNEFKAKMKELNSDLWAITRWLKADHNIVEEMKEIREQQKINDLEKCEFLGQIVWNNECI